MSRLFALLACLVCAASARAQIVYEPVQYQYGPQQSYYYGGSNPEVFRYAEATQDGAGRWGRVHGWAFASGDYQTHREVATEPIRVYADALGFQNGTLFGYTANDARNEAYANVPTYFRKRDLVAAAVPSRSGGWVVPAQAQPVSRAYAPRDANPSGALRGKPVMIIPKRLLDQKLMPPRQVAEAR
ncbi:MAG: hypothetical protein ACREJC_21205 [Tepidisphaeraceae bacterium]